MPIHVLVPVKRDKSMSTNQYPKRNKSIMNRPKTPNIQTDIMRGNLQTVSNK